MIRQGAEGGPEGEHEDEERRREVRRRAERRRRLDEVFGATPEQTRDDLDLDADGGSSRSRSAGRVDTWLREQVPPHHGG